MDAGLNRCCDFQHAGMVASFRVLSGISITMVEWTTLDGPLIHTEPTMNNAAAPQASKPVVQIVEVINLFLVRLFNEIKHLHLFTSHIMNSILIN